MDIQTKEFGHTNPIMPIHEFVAHELDDRESHGQLESVEGVASNTRKAFGRLVELLVEKQVITKSDVLQVAGTPWHSLVEEGQ